MTEPELQFVQCPDAGAAHRMAYWLWGDPSAPQVVLCVHGLSRQGRDFDTLARALRARAGERVCVVCPDLVGRGRSDWLKDPALYQYATYVADLLVLLAQFKPQALDWVGTSMGGVAGMITCGQPGLALPAAVRRLVLNDVGPSLSWEAVARIGGYLGQAGSFGSLEDAATALRAISPGFGPHTPQQWLELSRHMVAPLGGAAGRLRLHYDPGIAVAVRAATRESVAQGEAGLWQLYDNIRAKTLLLRGMQSDVLSAACALEMTRRGPKARLVEFAGVGHAPTLVADDQLESVCGFLLAQGGVA